MSGRMPLWTPGATATLEDARTASGRIRWQPVVARAAELVDSYDTPVTLRQVFYRLVAEGWIDNSIHCYQHLSDRLTVARREDGFPDLADNTRRINRELTFDGPRDALDFALGMYERDRTEGQPVKVLLGVEKDTMVAQLRAWFRDKMIPIAAFRGYGSYTLLKQIEARNFDLIIYAGDFDPTGVDIDRYLAQNLDAEIQRIAVTPEQVEGYGLEEWPGKEADPRADEFVRQFGRLVQVELEALSPDVLRGLFEEAIADVWDEDTHQVALDRENEDRERLGSFIEGFEEDG